MKKYCQTLNLYLLNNLSHTICGVICMKQHEKNIRVRQESPIVEDATRYGEFIARFHKWPTFEIQQKRAEHLAEVTKNPQDIG